MEVAEASAQPSNVHSKYDIVSQQSDTQDGEQPARRNSAAQATDGQGNFEVGGNGSGESYIPCKSNGSFRGGMNWPDRGSVCSPRPSREPDAFANSLRKYPNVSPERSTEVVERLINYTQAKHLAKSYQSRNSSPSHQGIEYNIPSQDILDRGTNRSYHRSFSYLKSCDRNINAGTKVRSSLEESPTRDIRPMSGYNDRDYADRRLRNSDLKYGINMSNRVRTA
ncbi:unnamed protein product [Diatraea saccharalis]|uniref:Uncharacterized protein n=1 Tax=Diatraea saccharalis TaxID=40085 RepID=A0A9N9RD71_9NEOP|nr:unnamed protein product [Diatraea saccharalis]